MTDRQSTHAADCWGWGPKHYECAVAEIERLREELSKMRGDVEYEYEVWQHGACQAGGRGNEYASAQSEASHYAMMYAPDGPVEVRIYEKRLLSAVHQPAEQRSQPKHSPYNSSGSLSEYGVFPECDTAPATQAPRACTCHPDDRPDGHCRERYAASECQALAAQAQAANADANMNEQIAATIARAIGQEG